MTVVRLNYNELSDFNDTQINNYFDRDNSIK